MIEFKVTTEGFGDKHIDHLSKELADLRKPLKQTGIVLMKSIDDNFRAEGRPTRWAPLSPMTIAMRRGRAPYRILQDTGALRRSITMLVGEGYVKVGTSKPYAPLLHFGGETRMPAHTIEPVKAKALRFTIGGKVIYAARVRIPEHRYKVPARPFVMIQKQDDEDIQRIFGDRIKDIIVTIPK